MEGMGETVFTLETLESIFNVNSEADKPQQTNSVPAEKQEGDSTAKQSGGNVDAKAFAARLTEDRNKTAKLMGFESYESMMEISKTKNFAETIKKADENYDPEKLKPIVEQLAKEMLVTDPRWKQLEDIENIKKQEMAKSQLAELSKLTGESYNSLDQIPKEVLDDWTRSGDLKSSYWKIKGDEFALKIRAQASKGVAPIPSPHGTGSSVLNTRPLTEQERSIAKQYNPSLTNEDLDKMTRSIK